MLDVGDIVGVKSAGHRGRQGKAGAIEWAVQVKTTMFDFARDKDFNRAGERK